jgi:bile acid-coenzyme A ligase
MALTPLGEVVADLAARYGDRAALSCGDATVSWSDLEARTNRLARWYRSLGVGPDGLVGIALPNSVAFVEATIATWKAGATPQPISERLPAAEREALIELAGPQLLVGADAYGVTSLAAGEEPPADVGDAPLRSAVAASLKALASGGSTGRPKLIVHGAPAALESLVGVIAMARMGDGGVHLATGPLHHNGPFLFGVAGLLAGNHLVVLPRFDAAGSLHAIERHGVDWMYAVPTMMQRIWRLPTEVRLGPDLSSLRSVLHLAAPCPPWLKEAWIDWLGPERILELYAGTEAQAVTFLDGVEWLAHRGSVGKVVTGEMVVLDEAGEPVPAGTVGTIWMRPGEPGTTTYRYVGAEARTRDGGWETLGDMGWMDGDGYLYLTDRETDMIVVGGSNVYPAEVEGALLDHPAVVDACVIGLPDEDLGSRPHALVHLRADVTDDELTAHVRARLAPYKCPRSWERVDEPLRDDAGKVRRSALRAARLPA